MQMCKKEKRHGACGDGATTQRLLLSVRVCRFHPTSSSSSSSFPFFFKFLSRLFPRLQLVPSSILSAQNRRLQPISNNENGSRHIAIVTGSNTGIGLETAASLVEMGFDVILACRSRDKGEAAASVINNRMKSTSTTNKQVDQTPGRAMFLHPLDLSNMSSVKSFVTAFRAAGYKALHILVNNGGINFTAKTEDGLDLCFATNFLGHFSLTKQLLPELLKAENTFGQKEEKQQQCGRIINLSSVMHHFISSDVCKGNRDDNQGSYYEEWWKRRIVGDNFGGTYSESKLAMILFSIELNRRYGKDGLRSISVNPGAVNSDIWRNMPFFLRSILQLFYLNSKEGSQTSVAAAVGDVPQQAIYLQPYWMPPIYNKNDSMTFARSYSLPFPVFEMLGPFVGYTVTTPRLPYDNDDGSDGLKSGIALWEVCTKTIETLSVK